MSTRGGKPLRGFDGARLGTYGAGHARTRYEQSSMLCLLSPEAVVPAAHPARRIKVLADEALAALRQGAEKGPSSCSKPRLPHFPPPTPPPPLSRLGALLRAGRQ